MALSWLKSVLGRNEDEDRSVEGKVPRAEKTEITVTGVTEVSGIGTVVTAKVESGVLRRGDSLVFRDKTATVRSIEQNHDEVDEAEAGDRIGMELDVEPSAISEGETGEVR